MKNTTMTAREELIQYILSMTPEQVDKFLNHPTTQSILNGNFDSPMVASTK